MTINPSDVTLGEFDRYVNEAIDTHPNWTNPRTYGDESCLYMADVGECPNCLIGYVLFTMMGLEYDPRFETMNASSVMESLGFQEDVRYLANEWQSYTAAFGHDDAGNRLPRTWAQARECWRSELRLLG